MDEVCLTQKNVIDTMSTKEEHANVIINSEEDNLQFESNNNILSKVAKQNEASTNIKEVPLSSSSFSGSEVNYFSEDRGNHNWANFDDDDDDGTFNFTPPEKILNIHSNIEDKSMKKPAIPPRLSLGEMPVTGTGGDIDFAICKQSTFGANSITHPVKLPPPIPPRASELLLNDLSTNGPSSQLKEEHNWFNFEELNQSNKSFAENDNGLEILSLETEDVHSSQHDYFSNQTESPVFSKEETKMKSRRLSVKKPSNGYLNLTNDEDDFDLPDGFKANKSKVKIINEDDHDHDCSPTKPLSKWATFNNEEDGSKEEINVLDEADMFLSVTNATDNDSNEIDLEDDFSLHANRLSVDMSELKGFNRDDKGSQNNLVDFSSLRDGNGSLGEIDDVTNEDEQETIFDLTAQGDSLKRRRPKDNAEISESDIGNSSDTTRSPVCHDGPAALEECVETTLFLNEDKSNIRLSSISSTSSRTATPAHRSDSGLLVTNPFWAESSSSVQINSIDNSPFDSDIFSNITTAKTISINNTPSPTLPAGGPLVKLPPPPNSILKSSQRSRRISSDKSLKTAVKKLSLDEITTKEETNQLTHDFDCFNIMDTFDAANPKHNEATDHTNKPLFNAVFDDSQQKCIDEPPSGMSLDFFPDKCSQTTNPNLFEDDENVPVKSPTSFENFLDSTSSTGEARTATEFNDVDISIQDTLDTSQNEPTSLDIFLNNQTIETVFSPVDEEKLTELTKSISVESPTDFPTSFKVSPNICLIPKKNAWPAYMRFPREKRAMSTRKWVEIFVRISNDKDGKPVVQLFYTEKTKVPFHTVSIASHHMQYTEPKAQAQYSEDGQIQKKLYAVKIMVVYYKEKRAFSPKRNQFAIRNLSGFKHTSHGKQSVKIGFEKYVGVCSFVDAVGDAMFNYNKRKEIIEKEHIPTVKYHSRDEVLINACDKVQAIISEDGKLEKCSVQVHMHVISFLSGDPAVKITINDKKLEGKEVVRREDIIPTTLDRWIDIYNPEMHSCCTADSYPDNNNDNWGTITFYPPDACKAELMRFSAAYNESELPVIVRSSIEIKGAQLKLRSIVRMSEYHSTNKDALTQVPCEDVMIRFPVPVQWANFFRVDGRFRNHNVHAKRAARQRRPGGVAREAGVNMETSIGNAKYEKTFDAIVWRIPQLPEKNAVQNTPQVFTCTIELPSDCELKHLYEKDCDCAKELYQWSEVEYKMPTATASHVCVRSVSLPNTDRAEKFVCYSAHYLYKVKMSVQSTRVSEEGMEDKAYALCNVQ